MPISFNFPQYFYNFRIGASFVWAGLKSVVETITGTAPLKLAGAVKGQIISLIQQGKIEQATTPTPSSPQDIVCNNGTLRMVDDDLPSGYVRLSYVESDGTDGYVNTGIVIDSVDTDVEVDYQYLNTSASLPKMTWGYMDGASNIPRWGFGVYSSGWLGSPNNTATRGSSNSDRHTAIMRVYQRSGVSYYSGTLDGDELYGENALGNVPLFEGNVLPLVLFARNNKGTVGNFANAKIFRFKVTKAGTLTHDLVPCKNDSDALGFYDLVTETFLVGTGTLTAGAADYTHSHLEVVGTPEVLSVGGKNLFDVATVGIEQGAISSSDGGNPSATATYRVRTAGYVPVKPNTQYTLSVVIDGYTSGSSRGIFILEYATDAVEGYTGDNSGWKTPNGYTFTTGATTNYIRIVFAAGSNSNTPVAPSDISNAQLEYGSIPTTYEPYKGVSSTASVESLFAVGNVQDEQNIISGHVVRRIGIYVFDGTETWIDGNYGYITEVVQNQSGETYTPLSTHFRGTTGTPQSNSNTFRCYRTSGGVGRIYFAPNRTTYDTKEKFGAFIAAQYAAGTPVIVVYPLAKEVTETVTPQPLAVEDGDNVISISANVDDIALEVSYNKSV